MAMTDKQKFINNVEAWAQEKFGGCGDLEVEDVVDVVDYYTSTFGTQPDVFQQMLQNVCIRIHGLEPNLGAEPRRPTRA